VDFQQGREKGMNLNFDDLFLRNPIPMWIHDSKTLAFLDANSRFLEKIGYNHTELLQMRLGDIFPLDEIPLLFTSRDPDQHSQPVAPLQHLCTKDGAQFSAELYALRLDYGGRRAQLIHVVARDDQLLEKRTLEARLRISEFAHSNSLDGVLQETLDEAEVLTGSTVGFFHFMEADQKTLWLQNWSSNTLKSMCTAEGKLTHYPVEQAGIWADCVRRREPVVYNDYLNMGRIGTLPKGHAHISRILTVPVLRGDVIVAIVGVGNKPVNYDEKDVKTVSLLADLAWDIAGAKYAESALKTSEYWYRSVMDQASDGIFITDLQGRYIDVNQAGCEMLGYTRSEILQMSIHDLLVDHPENPLRLDGLQRGEKLLTEHCLRRKDGNIVLVEISGRMLKDGRLLGIVRDITERKKEEERLKYLALVISKVSSAVISTDVELRIVQWNKGAETLYGWQEQEVLGRNIDEVCQTDFPPGVQEEARRFLGEEKKWRGQLRQCHRDGRSIWVDASVTLLESECGSFVGGVTINHDITERKLAEDELLRTKDAMEQINRTLQNAFEREQVASRTDSLTGAFNRRYFFELIEYEFAASRRYQRPLSIVMFDIDTFKRINDTYGHQVGDEILTHAARVVRDQLRETDILSRYGGDEFVILLPNSDSREAAAVLKRIHRRLKLSKYVVGEDIQVNVTISAGIASWQPGMENPAQLIHQADEALYAAKGTGRDRMVVFDAGEVDLSKKTK